MTTPPIKLGIAIDLDELRRLMREFMSEVVTDDDNNIYAWPFETFLQWAKKKRRASQGPCSACGDGDTAMKYHNHDDDNNLLTFRIEKGAGNGTKEY